MRTCPICHARAFDDAEICYGCMHRFGKREGRGASPQPASEPGQGPGSPRMPQPGRPAAEWMAAPAAQGQATPQGKAGPAPEADAHAQAIDREGRLPFGQGASEAERQPFEDFPPASIRVAGAGDSASDEDPLSLRESAASARGADIVVRIEVVGAAAGAAGQRGAAAVEGKVSQAVACQLLRRGSPQRGTACARPADAQRGASAGQGADGAGIARARHAAQVQVQAVGA